MTLGIRMTIPEPIKEGVEVKDGTLLVHQRRISQGSIARKPREPESWEGFTGCKEQKPQERREESHGGKERAVD